MDRNKDFGGLLFYYQKESFSSIDVGNFLTDYLKTYLINKGIKYLPHKEDPYDPDWTIPIKIEGKDTLIVLVVYASRAPFQCSVFVSNKPVVDQQYVNKIGQWLKDALLELNGISGIDLIEAGDGEWTKKIERR